VSLYNVHGTSTHCVSPVTYFGALTNWAKLQSTAAPGKQAHFLRRWLVCPHIAPGSRVSLGSADNHDGARTCVWN